MRSAREVIIRPLVSEASNDAMALNKYTFVVARDAGKIEIRRAIEEIFKVRVTGVNTMRQPGKERRFGVHVGVRPSWKKAIVTVAQGQTIEIFH